MTSRMTVGPCHPSSYTSEIPHLAALLKECVEENITMNFILPFSIEDATAFWTAGEDAVRKGVQILIVAHEEYDDTEAPAKERVFMGCVILYLVQSPNGSHRAEVGKLIVTKEARGKGVGRLLLNCLEDQARKHNRTVIFLDTETGSGAEKFYDRMGYTKIGLFPGPVISPDKSRYVDIAFFYKKL